MVLGLLDDVRLFFHVGTNAAAHRLAPHRRFAVSSQGKWKLAHDAFSLRHSFVDDHLGLSTAQQLSPCLSLEQVFAQSSDRNWNRLIGFRIRWMVAGVALVVGWGTLGIDPQLNCFKLQSTV